MGVQKFIETCHMLSPLGPHGLLVVLKYHFVALQLHHSVACTGIIVMKVLEQLGGCARRLACQPRVTRFPLQLSQWEIRFLSDRYLKDQIAYDWYCARAIVNLKK